ncbi:MAG: toll/interleukin-1 receptor domain-containing protein [Lachnospiraceae bacterium]|nr:toll/interleukin-1 receptor domain-containing protein [Lachnospiraceae bacterium]
MSVFKCKMCGGTLELQEKETVAVCEYCGTKQTIPKLDNDRRRNLYDRANHFRRNNEYDKAMGIYEQILNEDQEDAEAYWSLVLCRYGIEYVEDEETHRRVPTVNRTQFTSVFADGDYKSALQYADGAQRAVYEEEAKAIDEIQKGILEISEKEEPFDVFLCYKETDRYGKRTPDSVLANDIYHHLTEEGFKVFFSRITLEDKLGTAYEPYIFAALNSARVMVVLGTKQEYYNAAWVKNEWSRYLALSKKDRKKTLIPAYRDMDPYDLPEEFSHLQAQDMSELGFMQDLIRGIKKILASDGPKGEKEPVSGTDGRGGAGVAALLKRVFMFLEDGEWVDADQYCERVLDQEPENAKAYLGKLMAELHVHREEELRDLDFPFDDKRNYQKAVRFGDEKTAGALKGYVAHIVERNETRRQEAVYGEACAVMEKAVSADTYGKAAGLFSEIPGYRDADILGKECTEKRNDLIYRSAKGRMEGTFLRSYEDSLEQFKLIPGWKDADEQAALCREKIEEIKRMKEEEEAEKKRQAEKRRRRDRKIFIIVATVVFACVAAFVVWNIINLKKLSGQYQKALDYMDAGNYDEAVEIFEGLGDYKSSPEKASLCRRYVRKYQTGIELLEAGNDYEAFTAFRESSDYKDSQEKLVQILQAVSVGDSFYFGVYNPSADYRQENVEWKVLAKEEDRILVVSKYSLWDMPYCSAYNTIISWEGCLIRQDLNQKLYGKAFNEFEQGRILEAEVNVGNGRSTNDKLFLLSKDEVSSFFPDNLDRSCNEIGTGTSKPWWLRLAGDNTEAPYVKVDGSIVDSSDEFVWQGVRPAMWISTAPLEDGD